jgi:hypothetical protein
MYRSYTVDKGKKQQLLDFILTSLEGSGCRIIQHSSPETAPFKISFETPAGERMGVLAYAFFANTKPTKNRHEDEYRFQVKYGKKDGKGHEIWQDPYGLYTTLFMGISPEEGFFVGADPVLHNPTKFFISIELKRAFVEEIQSKGWATWERERRSGSEDPVEILVGGRPNTLLDFIRFEREAVGEDQGHRQLLAENRDALPVLIPRASDRTEEGESSHYIHALAREFEMSPPEVLDLIASARRLKMAVRGWVAEVHLVRTLEKVDGVTDCARIEKEGGPDVSLRFEGSSPLTVECKNVLRDTTRDGLVRLDFQRTRASKKDPCTRYYRPEDFDVVAACLHAQTQSWEYQFALTRGLDQHAKCKGRLSSNVKLDDRWNREIRGILGEAARIRG